MSLWCVFPCWLHTDGHSSSFNLKKSFNYQNFSYFLGNFQPSVFFVSFSLSTGIWMLDYQIFEECLQFLTFSIFGVCFCPVLPVPVDLSTLSFLNFIFQPFVELFLIPPFIFSSSYLSFNECSSCFLFLNTVFFLLLLISLKKTPWLFIYPNILSSTSPF